MKFFIISVVLIVLMFGCTAPSQTPSSTTSLSSQNTITVGDVMGKNTVKIGDTVSLDYVGTLDNGTVFDTSIQPVAQQAGLPSRSSYAPFTFVVGSNQVIVGFDRGVIGMKVNEEKTIHIEPPEAYGEKSDNFVITIQTANVTGGENLTVGSTIYANGGANQGRITKIENGTATVDFNHALAGKALNFKLILRSIQ